MAGKVTQTAGVQNTGDAPGLRILKILVVVMGVLIVVGTAIVGVTIINRIIEAGNRQDTASLSDRRLEILPPGARVLSVAADAGRLYLHVETADGAALVLALDGTTGERLATFDLVEDR